MFEFQFPAGPMLDFDSGASGGDGGAPSVETGSVPSNSGIPNQTAQTGQTNPLLQQSPSDFVDFAGRKVPVVDPVIRDIHRDYSELNRTYQNTNQQYKQMQEQNQQLMQMVQTFQQMQQQSAQPAEAQPTQEDYEAIKEEFMNTFYDDPRKAIQSIVDAYVKPVIEPIQKEKAFNQQVEAVQSKYTDFRDMVPAMQEVLRENPALEQMGLETVYLAAKGKTAQSAPTPEQMLADPNFRQMVMSNPEISQQIVSSYLSQKQQSQSQVPPLMGASTGGQMLATPENRPTSIRGGSKAFLNWLGMGS